MDQYTDLFNLEGKVAIVTGSAGILGSEFCKALCKLGANVACFDVEEISLNQLIGELSQQYGNSRVKGFLCDVSDANAVAQAVTDVITYFADSTVKCNKIAK